MEGLIDSFATVELDKEVFVESFAGFLDAFNELVGDFGGVLVAGIVLGDDDDITVFAEDFAAEGAGRFVAATSTTMERNNAALVIFDGFEDFLESVGGMSVVDNNFKILALVYAVHATFNGGEGGNAVGNFWISKADFFADGEGGERVVNVKLTRDLSNDFYITT